MSAELLIARMLIQEILSGKTPYSNISPQLVSNFRDIKIMQAIRRQELPRKPRDVRKSPERESLWIISTKCWNHNHKKRMTIKEAIDSLTDADTNPNLERRLPTVSSYSAAPEPSIIPAMHDQTSSKVQMPPQSPDQHRTSGLFPANLSLWRATPIAHLVLSSIENWSYFHFFFLTPKGIEYSLSTMWTYQAGSGCVGSLYGGCNSPTLDKRVDGLKDTPKDEDLAADEILEAFRLFLRIIESRSPPNELIDAWRNFYLNLADRTARGDTIDKAILPNCFARVRKHWYLLREDGCPEYRLDKIFEKEINDGRREYIIKSSPSVQYIGRLCWQQILHAFFPLFVIIFLALFTSPIFAP